VRPSQPLAQRGCTTLHMRCARPSSVGVLLCSVEPFSPLRSSPKRPIASFLSALPNCLHCSFAFSVHMRHDATRNGRRGKAKRRDGQQSRQRSCGGLPCRSRTPSNAGEEGSELLLLAARWRVATCYCSTRMQKLRINNRTTSSTPTYIHYQKRENARRKKHLSMSPTEQV
jgi:hypothetical protein